MKEYAFDITLAAVCRVKAETEAQAREAMAEVLDACSPNEHFLSGYNSKQGATLRITEFSITPDDSVYPQGAILFEVNGEDVDEGAEVGKHD